MNVINKTIEQTTAHLKFDAIKTLIEHSPIENEFLYTHPRIKNFSSLRNITSVLHKDPRGSETQQWTKIILDR